MSGNHRRRRAEGGNISEKELSRGNANGVISGKRRTMSSESLSVGKAQAQRSGRSSKSLSLGMPTGRTMATGGRAIHSGDERLAEARKRNEILGGAKKNGYGMGGFLQRLNNIRPQGVPSPLMPKIVYERGGAVKKNEISGGTSSHSEDEFAQGGAIHKRMKSLYKALHSHFDNEPPMKKLHARRGEVYEGEPHRESKKEMRRAGGGKMWIKNAMKKPGALHRALGVPKGRKIPVKTLEKAEHSRNPLTRKRAHLAETLRKLHH